MADAASGIEKEEDRNKAFRAAIARAEQSATAKDPSGYSSHNTREPYNALGRYQLTRSALLEAKWKVGDTWNERAQAFGVASDDDFKNNPAAQEAALADVMKDYERLVKAHGLLTHVGQTYGGIAGSPITISEAGLVAAAHRGGPTATANYLQRRVNGQTSDSAKTDQIDRAIETRLRTFANIPYQRGW